MRAVLLPDCKNDGSGVWKCLWSDVIGQQNDDFSSCWISRSGGGSLPDTMTHCLKLGSPSEKRSRVCLSTAKKSSGCAANSSSITSMASIRCVLSCPPVCVMRPSKICSSPPICIWRTQAPVTRTASSSEEKANVFCSSATSCRCSAQPSLSNTASRYFCCFVSSINPAPFPAANAAN